MFDSLEWKNVDIMLNSWLDTIFCQVEKQNLSPYQKRKLIFDFLVKNVKYDYQLLVQIMDHTASRNNAQEIEKLLTEKIGICSSISQVYKLLLEKENIYSMCILCHDGSEVIHQILLVQNEDETLSFDDATSVIVKRGTEEDFFDYDLEDAKALGQGLIPILRNQNFVPLSSLFVHLVVGREDTDFERIKSPKIRDDDEKTFFPDVETIQKYKGREKEQKRR